MLGLVGIGRRVPPPVIRPDRLTRPGDAPGHMRGIVGIAGRGVTEIARLKIRVNHPDILPEYAAPLRATRTDPARRGHTVAPRRHMGAYGEPEAPDPRQE
ncbi:hypothetical protein GCM10009682_39720 [Luedemannella flava]|uniref:Uncharacterized protein n=1 Tax=Luedemannella flava TaxID=349316 RepID=A0ABN2M8N4_9ACTN